MKNTNLHLAKDAKNDEFYTKYEDVEAELRHYHAQLNGKSVFCNFDNPQKSAFWKYLHEHFNQIGLKSLTAIYYDEKFPVYKMSYTGGNDQDILSGNKTLLSGTGDFLSQESLDVLQVSDVVITNPAFSLFKDLIKVVFDYKKQFLIIGNKNAVTCKIIFPLIKADQIRFGHHAVTEFLEPNDSIKKFGNICWFTNLIVDKEMPYLSLTKTYTPEDYPMYANFEAINVDRLADIPYDYDGVMGVPLTFLDKYNPDQFEIVGYNLNECVEELGIRPVGEAWIKLYQSQGGTAHITPSTHYLVYMKNGKAVSPYRRILIKRK